MFSMRAICSAAVAAAVSGSQLSFTDPSNLVLLQQRAEFVGAQTSAIEREQAAPILGKSVPLSEKGYQTIAALNNDQEMKEFIHRVLEKEARYATEPAELNGLVPFYSGTHSVQSLDALKREIR